MADINASFEYDADFGPAIAQVRSLSREISLLNNSFNSLDKTALAAKKTLSTSFQANVASLGMFQSTMVDLSSDVDRFGEALQKNKLHMRDYFKEARRAYTEGSKVRKLAVEQVRRAQSEILSLGKDSSGRNKGMIITPMSIDTKSMTNSMAIAREQFNIFNKLVQDGSRELINWGKNTQWAGRQLTVGLTVPLTIMGATLSKTFRDFDKELTRFQKVYGSDLVNTTTQASTEMRKQVELLAKDIAGKFGIAVSETAALAADLAATGLEGEKLTNSIQQTTRLAVLGEVDRQEAMKATLALQNAFNMSTQELSESINFLNAVENQTSVSIQDLTEAIPRTGPVINALGGDVKDLSVLLVAMKEGGISAAEGANAIKSGMASLINPTKQAAATAKGFGIDLEGIVTRNKGKLMPTILEFQSAMMGLDEFARAQIIEQVFGKYQFARIAALFDNLNQAGSQTVEVIKLMSASSTDLANTANAELRTLTESTSMRFQRAMESIKASLLPIGETLTRSVIPFLEKAAELFSKLVEFGQGLPEPVKNFIKLATGITAIAGPIVMITGVLANFLGYVTKGAMGIVNLGRAVAGIPTKQFDLLNDEQIIALKTTDLLTASYQRQDQTLSRLTSTMGAYIAALRNQAATNPGQFVPGSKAKPVKRANGGSIPGTGNTDSVPALLMPGEFVVNKEATQKYGPVLNAMNEGNIKGFAKGSRLSNNDPAIRALLQERSMPFTGIVGGIIDEIILAFDIQNEKIIKAMKQFDAAHITPEVDPATGKKVFNPQNLVAASAVENNTLSMLTTLGRGGSKGNVVAFRKSMGNAITQLIEQGFSREELKASARSIIKGNQPVDKLGTKLYESALADLESRISSGNLSVAQKGRSAVPGKSISTRVAPWISAGRAVSGARLSGQLPLLDELTLSGAVPAATGATTGVKKAIKSKSPAKEVQKQADQVAEIYSDSFENRLNANAKDAERAGENYGKASVTGLGKAKQRAANMGRGILARGSGMANASMGAAFALNTIGAMNEGFANATAGLTKFVNGLTLATSAMQMMQMGGIGGIGGKLKSGGKSLQVLGRAKSIAGGPQIASKGLMMAGRALSLLGGPVGFAAIAAITAVTAGIIAYRKSISEARKAGEAMYASQTAAAEYYGITLKSVNDQMKANAATAKNLGLTPTVSAQGVDPSLKKAILDQEENKKLVEQLKSSSDPASLMLGQYGKMLQQGFSPEQAKEVLSVLAQASSRMGALTGMNSTLSGITTASQATAAVGQSFAGNLSQTMGIGGQKFTGYNPDGTLNYTTDKDFSGKDKARLEGAFSGVIGSALLSPDLGEGLKVLEDSIASAFALGAKNGISDEEIGKTLNKSIGTQLTDMGFKEGDPIFEAVNSLGTSAEDTKDKMLLVQAAAAGIDMSRFLADGKASQEELRQIAMQLAQIDAAAQIDLQLDAQLQTEINSLNEVKAAETARYDNLIAKNERAKQSEDDRHKNFQKNIDKQNKALEKQIKKVEEGSDKYIDSINKENEAQKFAEGQRQTALGGLQSLANGDVFGFIQAQQQMAGDAASFGREQEIKRIEEVAAAAEKKLQDQIDKNNELADGEDERHEKKMAALDAENERIQRNKASTLQSIDAAIAQAQKLKDLAPGANLSDDMNKYIGTLGTLATKLPPQAQKLVSDLANTFNADFNKIVNDSITSAGKEFGISNTDQLSLLIKDSISTIDNPDNRRNKKAATGGFIQGAGTKNSDSIPARLSNGEYVVRASAVDQYGVAMLNQINEKKFATGGFVGSKAAGTQTATALGYGAVTASAVKQGIAKAIGDVLANEEPGNDQGPSSAPSSVNYDLLGQVARILLGSARVTARGTYPSSGKAHSARYGGRAIDYGVGVGTSVYAMASGKMSRGYDPDGFGKYVSITHADGTKSLYAHLSGYDGKEGQVGAGKRIGFSGATGNVRGAHLHFEWSGLKPGSNPPGMRTGGETLSNGLAMLHQGEAVLTSPLTADLKAGIEAMKYNIPSQGQVPIDASSISTNTYYNINVNASGTNDPQMVAKQVVSAIRKEDKRRNFERTI